MNRLTKFFLLTAGILKGRIFNKNIPLVVGLHVTNRCNFNCVYCYGVYYDNKKGDFTTNDILKLVDELSDMGTRYITLTGGEPLLRDDIEIIIDRIKEENILCSMNTNGSLIGKKINIVKKLDSITISLDGAEKATNDKNRGGNTFVKIMEGIRLLKSNKIPFDSVTVVTKNNFRSLRNILELAQNEGFMAEFNLVQDPNSEINNTAKYQLPTEEVKEVLRQLIQFKKEGYPVLYANSSRKYALNWPFDYNCKILYGKIPKNFEYPPCYMGKFICHVESNGLVYPCGQLINNFPALDFRDVGFKKAWENVLNKRKCITCYSLCHNEQNLFYHLHPNVIINTIKRKLMR